ncbi:hypothetical protein Tco_0937135 [Tanacetum coccineum]|uniref:Uncharacterized protein n=1 Tax=Tanacetum coccineum TaxID=301880 RepID=A0ABQ5DE78_9ASTR
MIFNNGENSGKRRRDTVKNKLRIYNIGIVNAKHPRMLTRGHDLRSQRSGLKVKDSDDSWVGGLNNQISQKMKGYEKTTSPTSQLTWSPIMGSIPTNTCNNGKNMSEIQLEHVKEDELVAVVVKVMFGWWFEQDIDDIREEVEEDADGGEVCELSDLNNRKDMIEWQSMVWIEEDAKDGLAKQESSSLRL